MIEPPGLGERGSAIYQSRAMGLTDPAQLAIVTEAARTADRLDELDNIIQGKGVLNLMQFRVLSHEVTDDSREINVEVKFGAPLAEARQQQSTFSALVRTLETFTAAASEPAQPVAAAPASPEDELARRRQAREAKRAQ